MATVADRMYRRVGRDVRRSFQITCGLVPGYGLTDVHTRQATRAVADSISQWMAGRAAEGRPYLTGVMAAADVLYAWGTRSGSEHRAEPCVTFSGDVSPLYHADMSDGEVEGLLDELAAEMGSATRQTRVYVAYSPQWPTAGRSWVLEAEGETSPRAQDGAVS